MGYTALHYAALSGLKKCVEYLLAHGADPYIENKAGLSPCDLAMRENHHDIALLLESKMVFTGTPGKNSLFCLLKEVFISKSTSQSLR